MYNLHCFQILESSCLINQLSIYYLQSEAVTHICSMADLFIGRSASSNKNNMKTSKTNYRYT